MDFDNNSVIKFLENIFNEKLPHNFMTFTIFLSISFLTLSLTLKMTLIGFVIDSFFMFDAKFFKRKEIERSVFQSNEKSNKNLFDLSFL